MVREDSQMPARCQAGNVPRKRKLWWQSARHRHLKCEGPATEPKLVSVRETERKIRLRMDISTLCKLQQGLCTRGKGVSVAGSLIFS